VQASGDFNSVGVGTIWSIQNLSTKYEIKEVEYRILSVVEQTAGGYTVTAMMYAGSKFGAIDESRNLMATQQSMSQLTSSVVLQTAPLDPSIGVDEARLVPVIETEHVVGDSNDARDAARQNMQMFVLDFTTAAERVTLSRKRKEFVFSWLIKLNVGGRLVNQITVMSEGTPETKSWKAAPTKVNIWVGDKLDTSDANYTLSYNVMAQTADSGTAYEALSYGDPILADDGGETFAAGGGD